MDTPKPVGAREQLAQAPPKVTKRAARYREALEPGVNCRTCQSMNPDGSCVKVDGMVAPEDVCDLFTPTHASIAESVGHDLSQETDDGKEAPIDD